MQDQQRIPLGGNCVRARRRSSQMRGFGFAPDLLAKVLMRCVDVALKIQQRGQHEAVQRTNHRLAISHHRHPAKCPGKL